MKHGLDYESRKEYSVTVQAWDNVNRDGINDGIHPNHTIDDSITITIKVTDVDEPPDAPTKPTVTANAATPNTKLDVSWTAPTMTGKPAITGYEAQYRLSGAATTTAWTSYSFTGTSTKATLTGLATGKSYDVQVRATNDEGSGGWSSSGVGITGANAATRSVAENSAAGTAVGAAVTATSTNTRYSYTHALGGTDAASFDIDSATGQIKVKAALDYEATSTYSVVVTVTAAAQAQAQAPEREPGPQRAGRLQGPGDHQRNRRERSAGVSKRHDHTLHCGEGGFGHGSGRAGSGKRRGWRYDLLHHLGPGSKRVQHHIRDGPDCRLA